jgi:hypothetical protein
MLVFVGSLVARRRATDHQWTFSADIIIIIIIIIIIVCMNE